MNATSSASPGPAAAPLTHLLVVDDDLGTIEHLGRLLKGHAQVSFATSGEDALRLVGQRRPDVVLLDVELPGLCGFEVCRRLRADPRLAELSIVFATRHTDADTEAIALEAGADDFLRKPLDEMQLLTRLRAARNRARPRREEAAATQRVSASMLSYIAHEIGNPVNVIKGFAQLMQAEPLLAGQADKLSHILEAVDRLCGLMSDVSDVARMESGQFLVQLADIELRGLVRQACDQAAAQASAAGLELSVPPPAAPMHVRADARRLRQCLDNLLSNAIKYGRDGRRIDVTIDAAGSEIVLAVQDHGAGLRDDQLTRLFEPYNRLGHDGGTIPGTGLGLALTRDLMQAMGGALQVHSHAGRGCRFDLLLQASQD